jgi:hypothetical protein
MNPMTDTWTTFGRDQGQIVERAYRYDYATDRVIRRTFDRSDNSTTYDAATGPRNVEPISLSDDASEAYFGWWNCSEGVWNGSEGVLPWSEPLDWKPCDNPFSRLPNP